VWDNGLVTGDILSELAAGLGAIAGAIGPVLDLHDPWALPAIDVRRRAADEEPDLNWSFVCLGSIRGRRRVGPSKMKEL
jgi:hypothetical protein